jgi:hypothetical protein
MHKTMKVSYLYIFSSTTIPTLCNPKTCNTPFQVSKNYFWGNQLLLDTMKGIVIHVLGYFVIHHVMIHFGLRYQKGIARGHKDGVKLQYPSYGISTMLSG